MPIYRLALIEARGAVALKSHVSSIRPFKGQKFSVELILVLLGPFWKYGWVYCTALAVGQLKIEIGALKIHV